MGEICDVFNFEYDFRNEIKSKW